MIFKKDKNAVDLIVAHLDTAAQCIKTAGRAVESYIEGNLSEGADLALKADALESDANHKMGNILNHTNQSASWELTGAGQARREPDKDWKWGLNGI